MYGRTRAMPASMPMSTQYVLDHPAFHNPPPSTIVCPHCAGQIHGYGWWSDRWNDIKHAASAVADFAKPLLKPAASAVANFVVPGSGAAVNAGLSALGLGKPRTISQRTRDRNEIVRYVMKERSVPLGVASRIVKQEGLF
jgi:hypothetical protein